MKIRLYCCKCYYQWNGVVKSVLNIINKKLILQYSVVNWFYKIIIIVYDPCKHIFLFISNMFRIKI